jgi:hypothetical protein
MFFCGAMFFGYIMAQLSEILAVPFLAESRVLKVKIQQRKCLTLEDGDHVDVGTRSSMGRSRLVNVAYSEILIHGESSDSPHLFDLGEWLHLTCPTMGC